jgi:hypothetical protein
MIVASKSEENVVKSQYLTNHNVHFLHTCRQKSITKQPKYKDVAHASAFGQNCSFGLAL